MTLEQQIRLSIVGTVRIPATDAGFLSTTKSNSRLGRLLVIEESSPPRKPKVHRRYTVRLAQVSALFILNSSIETPKDFWVIGGGDDRWIIGRKILKTRISGKRGIVYVPEDTPVFVHSNQCEPFAAIACELDDVEATRGYPGKCNC